MVDIFTPIEQYIVYEGVNGSIDAKLELPDGFYFESNGYYFTATSNYGDMSVIHNNETLLDYDYTVGVEDSGSGDKAVLSTRIIQDAEGYHRLNEIFITKGLCMIDTYKEVNVPNMGSYVSSFEQLTTEQIESIKLQLDSVYNNENEGVSYTSKEMYAGNLKPTVSSDGGSTFAVYAVYRSPYDDFFGEYTEIFTIIPAYDIIVRTDGKIEFREPTMFDIEEVYTEVELQEYFANCPYSCVKIG